MKLSRRLGVAALAPVLLVSMAACGSAGSGASKAADGAPHPGGSAMRQVKTDAQAAKLVPADVKKRGFITMAADLHYPPTSFLAADNKTPVGFNVDFADLLGKELGLRVETKDVSFDSVIPGLAAGRYDFTATDMTPTADRLKVLDMITYWSDGSSLMVTKGNPLHLSLADLSTCGRKIAVMTGTTQQQTYLPEISAACQSAGKKAVDQVVLPNVQGALTQLAAQRIDGVFYDTPSLAWAAKQQPQFQMLSPQYKKRGADCTGSDTARSVCSQDIVALGVKQHSPLAPAVHSAVKALMSGPAYQAVLDKWGLGAGAISTSQLLK